jgi:hypothetical protein
MKHDQEQVLQVLQDRCVMCWIRCSDTPTHALSLCNILICRYISPLHSY